MIDRTRFLDLLVPIFRPILAGSKTNTDYFLLQAPRSKARSDSAYATITYGHEEKLGTTEQGCITTSGRQLKQHLNITVIIKTFGPGAVLAAGRLSARLEYESMSTRLDTVGTCFKDSTDVTDITSYVNTEYEQVATFEIILGTTWGNLSVVEYDPNTEGLPAKGVFDEDTIAVERLGIALSYNDNDTVVEQHFDSTGANTK